MPEGERPGISRRGFLRAGAALGGAAVLGGAGGFAAGRSGLAVGGSGSPLPGSGTDNGRIPFYGAHQAGIATPAQDRLAIAAFDVIAAQRSDLVAMLKRWTAAAALMVEGKPVGDVMAAPLAPPTDTGEAYGLAPARLTLTAGFGPSLFDARFGLAGLRPAALEALPSLPGDLLDPAISDGDLVVQACADDPQVCFHAVRNLARLGRGTVVMRWFQSGFGRTSSTSSSQETPRNLMGFKDGTNNIVAEDTSAMDRFVWVGLEADQPWMRGGTYLVARRIRMLIESWDRDGFLDQEHVFGRQKLSGAPLGETAEHDPVPLTARDVHGDLVIPADAHIRLAAPSSNGGQRILRRGYSFTDGTDPVTGQLEAGLFFICFQRDPNTQFVAIQRQLGAHDALDEYIKHTGSGLFACPPGLAAGGWWGEALLG
ncbi:MAG TPA: iron uptake transporter deferrochelatase/peroxidase subunit [Candidatus Limnocylindrales bacterium]|nr:iron uptake transporter deferrochelatase/peroxidase subunit [Candidatus Limnocylindrales bacterium]